MEDLLQRIKKNIDNASYGKRTPIIHFEVLMNYQKLENISGKDFCEAVEIQPTYKAEFSKMIALGRLLKSKGLSVKQ